MCYIFRMAFAVSRENSLRRNVANWVSATVASCFWSYIPKYRLYCKLPIIRCIFQQKSKKSQPFPNKRD